MKTELNLSKRQLFALVKLTRKLGKRYTDFLGTRGLAKIINKSFLKDISQEEYEVLKKDWVDVEPEELRERIKKETNDGFRPASEVLT